MDPLEALVIMLEIPQDTARAVTNLLFSGTLTKFKYIRFIFTHAGGNVPMVRGRMHQYSPKNTADKAPNGIEYELKRLYYDVAGTAYRPAIAVLTSLVSTTQILFGSDSPFIPLAETAEGKRVTGVSFLRDPHYVSYPTFPLASRVASARQRLSPCRQPLPNRVTSLGPQSAMMTERL
jgi:hypothetical protein